MAPSSRCTALGFVFDLEENTISLPEKKRIKLLETLNAWLQKSIVSEKQLASICGRLLHAASVIRSGKLLTTRLLAAKRLASSLPHKTALIDDAIRADLVWWVEALSHRNGVNFLEQKEDLIFGMDASTGGWMGGLPGLTGFDYKTGRYFHGPPPEKFKDLPINILLGFLDV